MVKVKARLSGNVKRKPVKAGSGNKKHGGLPTHKIILITKSIKRANNG